MKLLLLIALMIPACAPKAIIVDPMAPAAASLRAKTEQSATAAKRVSGSANEIRQRSTDIRSGIAHPMEQAERARREGATPEYLEWNYKQWETAHANSLLLEAAAKAMVIDATGLEKSTDETAKEASTLEKSAIVHDKSVETLKTDMAKQAGDAAVGKAIRNLVWVVIIGAIFLGIVWIAVKFIKPI